MKYFLEGFFIVVFTVVNLFPAWTLHADEVPSIVITEIGSYEKGNEEWLEIKNISSTAVDVEGWKFWENETNHKLNLANGADFLIEPGEIAIIADVASTTLSMYPQLSTYTVFDSSWSTLKEAGEQIGLKDSGGVFVEQFTYIGISNGSLERVDDMLQDYSTENWIEGESGNTIGLPYSAPEVLQEEDAPAEQEVFEEEMESDPQESEAQEQAGPTTETVKHYSAGTLIINELVSDPDIEDEWVELYNNSTELIDLSGWTLEDGNEVATELSGEVLPYTLYIVEKPKGRLNNSGDHVLLKDGTGAPIDRVTYGSWDDGNPHDNAPAAKDPFSLARVQDGLDSNLDSFDFAVTEMPTKGMPNIIVNDDTRSAVPSDSSADVSNPDDSPSGVVGSGEIVITEFLPNPVGSDGEGEFIELYNNGSQAVDLSSWSLEDATKKKYVIADTFISAGGYVSLDRSITNIALNNTGGELLTLRRSDERVADTASFEGSAQEGFSYAKSETGSWRWTSIPSPGAVNIFATANTPPIAVIDAEDQVMVEAELFFDASDSTDLEDDGLIFHWDFGDGNESTKQSPRHAYEDVGTYNVVLSVSDGALESKTARVITVLSAPVGKAVGGPPLQNYGGLRITEFMPDPAGADEAEWIELFNASDEPISLEDVKIDDEEGGSRGYVVDTPITMAAGSYHVLGRQQTRVALNNTADTVRLFDPFDILLASVSYDDPPQNASYALGADGNWHFTSSATPGSQNIITAAVSSVRLVRSSSAKKYKPLKVLPLERVRELDIGDRVQTEGVVSVMPGILGSQYFYIGAPSSSVGIQVYSFKKDYPKMAVGSLVQITGELSSAGDEVRIKTKSAVDINVLGEGTLEASAVKLASIAEQHEGALISVTGEITQRLSSKAYIDDGSDELLVYIKEGSHIQRGDLQEGDYVNITGVLSQTSSGYRLLPRSKDDIEKLEHPDGVIMPVIENNRASSITSFLGAAAGTLFSLLLALLAKVHMDRITGFWKGIKERF